MKTVMYPMFDAAIKLTMLSLKMRSSAIVTQQSRNIDPTGTLNLFTTPNCLRIKRSLPYRPCITATFPEIDNPNTDDGFEKSSKRVSVRLLAQGPALSRLL